MGHGRPRHCREVLCCCHGVVASQYQDYLKRRDVPIGVVAVGTPAGMDEFEHGDKPLARGAPVRTKVEPDHHPASEYGLIWYQGVPRRVAMHVVH
jgi:hypothetical protein